MSVQAKDTLLVSVGGSPQPVIYTIEHHHPEKLIFFCSRQSRAEVRSTIEPALSYRPRDIEIITTPDEQNLYESVTTLALKIAEVLELMGSDFTQLKADFTGGTKAMAAAVVLALADRGCDYSYVGGTSRDKEGLGVVLGGREQMLYSENPWDALGREPLKLFALHFNRCRFASAKEVAQLAALRSDKLKVLFSTLAKLAEGYGAWDNYALNTAQQQLNSCLGTLQTLPYLEQGRELTQVFAATLQTETERLQQLKNDMQTIEGKSKKPSDGQTLVLDLLANAVRRAEREHKYDDAVARLYSVIEKAAKIRLKTVFQIDNSAVTKEQLPPLKKELLIAGMTPAEDGRYKFPLYRSYQLLAALGDPLGQAYEAQEEELRKVMNIRNDSLLAHGFKSVSAETYHKMLHIALTFCGIEREHLPDFPRLPEL